MKKIIALTLAAMMLFSAMPCVMGADDIVDEDKQLEDAAKNAEGKAPDGFDPNANPTANKEKFTFPEFVDKYKDSGLTAEEIAILFGQIGAQSDIEIYIDGYMVYFSEEDVLPQIIDGRTMVPLRIISNQLGADVSYMQIDYKDTITITKGDLTLKFTVGENAVLVNGKTEMLDVPPMLIDDRTMVPFRFIFEKFGLSIEYEEPTEEYPFAVIRANRQ